jgi:murein DD-endopeptidase MepM/ murein hydrolase activator NlpD
MQSYHLMVLTLQTAINNIESKLIKCNSMLNSLVKNRFYKSLFLGISSAAITSASYALMTPLDDTESALIDPVIFSNQDKLNTITLFNPSLDLDLLNPQNSADQQFIEHIIKSGESLSSIFARHNLKIDDLHQIGKQFKKITSGKTLKLTTSENGELEEIAYQKNSLETVIATRKKNGFSVEILKKELEKQIISASGQIDSSFFLAGKEAGLPDKTIMQLTRIFRWDIDFALNIKQGDSFSIVYEKLYAEGRQVGTGNILAAEFINRGKTYKAVRYEDQNGNTGYYTPEGNGMRKAFIRTPVDFARISSHFNMNRRHPVLNRIRAHKGVDYAAKKGTPIKSTGDGIITFQGRQSGYGRVVIIQHGKHYSTLYAHMSAFSKHYKQGNQVKQGSIIGYVGQSGLASGPHLHYEFRIDNQHRDPLSVRLPNSAPVDSRFLAHFKKTTGQYIAQLEHAKNEMVAQNSQH